MYLNCNRSLRAVILALGTDTVFILLLAHSSPGLTTRGSFRRPRVGGRFAVATDSVPVKGLRPEDPVQLFSTSTLRLELANCHLSAHRGPQYES